MNEIKINLNYLRNFTMNKKKTVFISASSSGIGYYLAKKYKSLDYNLIINGTNKSKLKKASKNYYVIIFLEI
jgi:short-subunit dehydrogenase involved in D-alanine esterification of teichoic acids